MWNGSARTDLEWIDVKWPEPSARGLFSLRHGGVSNDPYESLNVGLAVGDNPERVVENRKRITAALGGDLSEWVLGRQVHGRHIHVVTEKNKGCGAIDLNSSLPETDGLITNCRNVTLAVLAADCVPVLFFDAVRQVIGAAHSGWRGTVAHISGQLVQQMSASFGTRPEDVHVWIGPSIRRCCYEVDETVAAPVRREFGNRFLVRRPAHKFGPSAKYLVGLQQCIRQDLVEEGVPSTQIHDTGLCTSCRVEHLYSHRREAGRTGRSLGAIRLS